MNFKKESMDTMLRRSQGDQTLNKDQALDKTRNLNSVLVQQRVNSYENLISESRKQLQKKQLSYGQFKLGFNDLNRHDLKKSQTVPKKAWKLQDQDKQENIKIKSSKFLSILNKIESYQKAQQSRNCCTGFLNTTKGELVSNNVPVNVVSTTSAFVPRTVRLTNFFLGLLLEISMVALFFNFEEQDEDSTFLEDFTENFWVGIYSVLLTIIPLFLVGCFLNYPQKYKKQLNSAVERSDFPQVLSRLNKKYKKILIAGYVLFFAFMIFLSLFLIAFGEKASKSISINWIESSFIAILIDHLALELLAALTVGLIMVAYKRYRFCKFLIFIAVVVEIYRLYRNISD